MISLPLIRQLKAHEGFRPTIYRCTAGHRTIGYGRNLDANPNFGGMPVLPPLTERQAEDILIFDIVAVQLALVRKCREYANAEQGPRREVLVNMGFNLGVPGLLEFRHFLAAFGKGDWEMAALEMQNSKWHRQAKDRAVELETQIRTGRYAETYA